jgi:Mg2+/citrate symporter
VGVKTVLLAFGVLLGVFRGTGTLGAGGNTAVGVVGLALAGARNLVAESDTAAVTGVTYGRRQVRPDK